MEEFEQGWEFMLNNFAQTELEEVGLSDIAIIISVFVLFIVLFLVCLALIYIISAWSGGSDFTSVVQSSAVAGLGVATTRFKKASVDGQSEVEQNLLRSAIEADADD